MSVRCNNIEKEVDTGCKTKPRGGTYSVTSPFQYDNYLCVMRVIILKKRCRLHMGSHAVDHTEEEVPALHLDLDLVSHGQVFTKEVMVSNGEGRGLQSSIFLQTCVFWWDFSCNESDGLLLQ
eukprot:jgi/Botrbrau1/3971/Bobra.0365s0044.1